MHEKKRMQQKHHSVKGRIVGLLSGVLTFGMAAGIIPGGGTETVLIAQAAEAISEPSVTDYATKEQLMSAFKTDNNGVGQNIGKLIFGKNSKGEAQEWYIIGRDSGISGNILIFAASPIATEVQFYSSLEDHNSWAHANDYISSDLDSLLYSMAGGTQFFSTKERELLKETDVQMENRNHFSRKLYALRGSYQSDIILAGRYNDKKISIVTYCSASDTEFWLRSATDIQGSDEEMAQRVLVVDPSQKKVAGDKLVTEKLGVRPVANLDLSDVLFASSYDGSNINNRDGMILRLDGKNKDIGTVTYNSRTNTVTAVRGKTTSRYVDLVVQYGKAGSARGIFSKTMVNAGEQQTWTGSEIFGNVNASDIDWSKCKIWLETKEDGMFYAVEATEDTNPITIDSIIAQINKPEAGKTLSTSVDAGDHIKAELTWMDNDQTVPADKIAEYYRACYTAHITFTPAKGYAFADSTKIQINDKKSTSVPIDGKITVETPFFSSKDKLKSITAPASITVANGTAYEDMNLPAQVDIVTEGSTVNKADVAWNTSSSPVNGNYDPAVLTEQTVILQGKVTCPETINANGVNLTTSITITISAAEENNIVEAPIADPEAGTYTENQTVTLKSTTEGAVIYYTTNGVEPSSTAGTKYTGPLTVAGMEGRSVEMNIKAIAVKDGMQDSAVMTYTYTINLSAETPEIKVPVITSQPQDVTVKEGETATFIVKATGTDLTYQWEIDTKGDNDFVSISGTTGKGASYTTGIRNMENNGTKYRCIVSNSAGFVTSRSATLTVADDTTPPSETTYIITATAGANGSISPSGSVKVKEGADQTFTITADEGYEIENLKVDSSEVSAASSYTFNNVTEEHSIEATFKQKVTNPDPGQPENPDPGKTEDPNPAEKPKPEVKKDEAPASSQAPQHEHSFNWVTVQTASAAQDGLEELRCSCGIVKERSVVPASQAYVNELYQNLSQALAEGEVSFDSGRIYTISDYLIRKLQERADVTTTITFEYNQDKYRMMIPAGVDYSELLEDEDYFYGYFYFAKKVGARVESL